MKFLCTLIVNTLSKSELVVDDSEVGKGNQMEEAMEVGVIMIHQFS